MGQVMTERPTVLEGATVRIVTGCGKLYVTINSDEDDNPQEILARLGKAGRCSACYMETIGRLLSLSLQAGMDIKDLTRTMVGQACHKPAGVGDELVLSCVDGIGKVLKGITDGAADSSG